MSSRHLLVLVSSLSVVAALLIGTSTPASADDGVTATYLYGNAHTSFDSSETAINASTASSLSLLWSKYSGSDEWSTNQPIEANGQIFWSDWSGTLHATNTVTHEDDWTSALGTTTSTCGGVTWPDSSATVATVGGVSTVFIGGGTRQVEALNAVTGQVIWDTQLSTDPSGMVWTSPALYDGSIYMGMASAGSCPDVRGELFKLDDVTGAIEATFYSVPQGCIGGGIWSSPTIDEATGILYVGTGGADECPSDSTEYTPDTEPDAQAIVALNASDLSLIGVYQPPDNAGDNDFGATPILFSATIGGQLTEMVGAVNKNGTYYALNRANLDAGPIWTHFIGVPGQCGSCTAEYSSNASFDGSTLYVAGDVGEINGVTCPGTLSALDPATGQARWADCLQQGRVLGAVTGAPGIVEVNAGDTVLVVDDTDGATLFSYTEPSGNYFFGPAYIADGVLYVSNNDGNLLAFAPAPGTQAPEAPEAPEAPMVLLLPVAAISIIGTLAVLDHRRRKRMAGRPRTVG
jgi:outer membrane protein assembly factor BamB